MNNTNIMMYLVCIDYGYDGGLVPTGLFPDKDSLKKNIPIIKNEYSRFKGKLKVYIFELKVGDIYGDDAFYKTKIDEFLL